MKLDPNALKLIGGAAALAIALADHWFFHSSFGASFDSGLVGAGLAVLGVGGGAIAVAAVAARKPA